MTTETDHMAPDSADPEDQAILEALEALASGEGLSTGAADEALRRLYVETLGLLPAGLEPVVPDDRVWQRLAAQLDLPGDLSASASRSEAAATKEAPAPAARMAPVSSINGPPGMTRATAGPSVVSRTTVRRAARWPLALAATLAFGLAGLSLFLLKNLDEQSDQMAALYVKLAAAERQTLDLREAKGKLSEIEEKYSLVTNPGVSVNRLAPAPTEVQPVQPDARGILFVAADHSHWVLALENLHPTDESKGYQLWFMGEGTATSGGTFTAQPGEVVKLSAESMPAGTKAILITLEPATGSPLPSGPKVLTTVG